MNKKLLSRLALDLTALALLLVALAYEWLGNTLHEIVGTSIFVLLVAHNYLNRRWYGGIHKGRRETRKTLTTAINLSLAIAMLAVLITSLMISRTVFSFLGLEGGLTVRQVHAFAAYWGLVFVSIHLGMHWTMIMSATRSLFGLETRSFARTMVLRTSAAALACHGIFSSFEMSIGSKLIMYFSFSYWDFENDWTGFFIHYVSIVSLYAVIAHCVMRWVQERQRRTKPFRSCPATGRT